MKEFALIACKGAAPRVRSGSYADGIAGQSLCLPLAVVGPYVNLPSSDHSEVASDENRFASCFLALCAKALSEAKIKLDFYFHIRNKFYYLLESWERLVKSTSSALSQNKRSICLCFGRRSVTSALESAQNFMKIKIHHKDKHFFRNCKFHSSSVQTVLPEPIRTANPVFPVPNPLSRPFGSANSHFPYRIDPLFCTARALGGLRYRNRPSGCTGPVSNPVPCEKPAHFCTRVGIQRGAGSTAGGGLRKTGFNGRRRTVRNRAQRLAVDCAKWVLENYFNVYLKIISLFCKVYLEILLMKSFLRLKWSE